MVPWIKKQIGFGSTNSKLSIRFPFYMYKPSPEYKRQCFSKCYRFFVTSKCQRME